MLPQQAEQVVLAEQLAEQVATEQPPGAEAVAVAQVDGCPELTLHTTEAMEQMPIGILILIMVAGAEAVAGLLCLRVSHLCLVLGQLVKLLSLIGLATEDRAEHM